MLQKEFYTRLKDSFSKGDRFAANNEIEIVDVKKGWAKAQVRLKQNHLNGVNIAHGGIIFTLADLVFSIAANSHGRVAVTLNASISFYKSAKEGTLITAESEELSLQHKVATYLVHIKDEAGELLATMKAQAYRKKEEIEF